MTNFNTGKNLAGIFAEARIAHLVAFTIKHDPQLKAYVSSRTNGEVSVAAGATRKNGTFTTLGDVQQEGLNAGSVGMLTLWSATRAVVFSGTVVLGEVQASVTPEGYTQWLYPFHATSSMDRSNFQYELPGPHTGSDIGA